MEEVNVIDPEEFQRYAEHLRSVKMAVWASFGIIEIESKKIIEELESNLDDLRCRRDTAKDRVDSLHDRYQDAIAYCGENCRDVIGSSDIFGQMEFNKLDTNFQMISNLTNTLISKMENTIQKTKNFAMQVDTMVERNRSLMLQRKESLEKYQEIKS